MQQQPMPCTHVQPQARTVFARCVCGAHTHTHVHTLIYTPYVHISRMHMRRVVTTHMPMHYLHAIYTHFSYAHAQSRDYAHVHAHVSTHIYAHALRVLAGLPRRRKARRAGRATTRYNTCLCICLRTSTHVSIHMSMHTHVHTHVCPHAYTRAYIHVHAHVCTQLHWRATAACLHEIKYNKTEPLLGTLLAYTKVCAHTSMPSRTHAHDLGAREQCVALRFWLIRWCTS